MKKCFFIFLLFLTSLAYAQEQENIIKLHTTLIPNAGSFVATSDKARGRLLKTKNTFSADRISVFSDSFETENILRDKHLADYLAGGAKRPFPRIDLTDLTGENNLAKAKLTVNNVTKDVQIKYSTHKNFIEAEFEIKTNDYNLEPASFLGVNVSSNVKITAKYFWEEK